MISDTVWTQGMQLLSEYFRRELSAALAAVYAEQIVPALSDAEFSAGVRILIRTKRPEFAYYPTIEDVLTAARGGIDPEKATELDAGAALTWEYEHPIWDVVTGYYHSEQAISERRGPLFLRALQSVGGAARLTRTKPDHFHFVRTEFLDALGAYTRAGALDGVRRELAAGETRRARIRNAPVPQIGSDVKRIAGGMGAPGGAPGGVPADTVES